MRSDIKIEAEKERGIIMERTSNRKYYDLEISISDDDNIEVVIEQFERMHYLLHIEIKTLRSLLSDSMWDYEQLRNELIEAREKIAEHDKIDINYVVLSEASKATGVSQKKLIELARKGYIRFLFEIGDCKSYAKAGSIKNWKSAKTRARINKGRVSK